MSSPLISDRIPFILSEKCKISVSGGSVVVQREGNKSNIPIRNLQLLILGNGTTITSEAMSLCSKERCHIAQSKGGVSIHTVFHAGLYQNPVRLTRQVLLANNPIDRLRIAKYLSIKKIETLTNKYSKEILDIIESTNIPSILGIEGAITKKEYKKIFGQSFNRQSDCLLNKNLNVLNSVFYSFLTSVICSLGYSPSIGFLHGNTRRGGFVFDIADIFKHKIYISNIELMQSEVNMARELSRLLQANRKALVYDIINEIEKVCEGCL